MGGKILVHHASSRSIGHLADVDILTESAVVAEWNERREMRIDDNVGGDEYPFAGGRRTRREYAVMAKVKVIRAEYRTSTIT